MPPLLRVDPTGRPAGTPVLDSDGDRVGTVTDTDGDTRYVSVHPDAPADTLDTLGWNRDADRIPLPDRVVATDADDAVRLLV